MYARGILFGKMKYELGDHSFVRCPEMGLVADLEFKTKGWVGGTYNAIGGTIRNENTGESLYEFSGLWSEEMYIKDLRVSLPTLLSLMPLPILTLLCRLAIKSSSSTHTAPSHHLLRLDHLRSKTRESLRNSGTKQPRQ